MTKFFLSFIFNFFFVHLDLVNFFPKRQLLFSLKYPNIYPEVSKYTYRFRNVFSKSVGNHTLLGYRNPEESAKKYFYLAIP